MTFQPIPYTVRTWDAFSAAQSSMFGNSAPAPSINTNTQPTNQPINIPQQPTWQSQASRSYAYPQNQQQQFRYPTSYNSRYPASYQGYSNCYSVPARFYSGQPPSNYYHPGFRPNMGYVARNGPPNPFSQQTSTNNMTASTTPATSCRVLKTIDLDETSPWKSNTIKGTIEQHLEAHATKWSKIYDQAKNTEVSNVKKLLHNPNLTEGEIQSTNHNIVQSLRVQNRALSEIIDIQESRFKLYNGSWQSQMSVRDIKDLYREHGTISRDNPDGTHTLSPWTVISQEVKRNYHDDDILEFYQDSSISDVNTTSNPTTTADQNTTQANSQAQAQEALRSILYGWKNDYDNRSTNANSWSKPSSYYPGSWLSGPSYSGPGSFAYNPRFGPAPMQFVRAY